MPRLVLLHGFGAGRDSWGPAFTNRLRAAGLDVRTPSAPGHDLTPTGDHLQAGLDLLQDGDWLAGWSMGAHTALRIALAHPGQVAGLVLLAPGAGGQRSTHVAFSDRARSYADLLERDGIEAFTAALHAQPRFAHLSELDRRALARAAADSDPADLAATARTELAARTPLFALTGTYRGPALILHGRHDPASAPAPELSRLLPAGRIQAIDAGHALHLEQPGPVSGAITGFLAAHAAPGADPARPHPQPARR